MKHYITIYKTYHNKSTALYNYIYNIYCINNLEVHHKTVNTYVLVLVYKLKRKSVLAMATAYRNCFLIAHTIALNTI